jgi:hypothetical protein
MKNPIFYIVVGLIAIFSLTSCGKIQVLPGKLTVEFTNYRSDWEIRIYSMENESYPIYKSITANNLKIELNAGDYIIALGSDRFAFQIKSGRTTEIFYNRNDIGSVTY